MNRFIIKIIFILVVALFVLPPNIASAQNSNGDYYKENLPYEDGGSYVVGKWRVIAPSGLNCRAGAGTEFTIVKTFKMDDVIYPKTSEGREQHNNPTELDKRGLPWLRLTSPRRSDAENCLIRANSRYISPEKEIFDSK
jgi:hypothetical protein